MNKALLLAAVLIAGCTHSSSLSGGSPAGPAKEPVRIVAIDTSGSAREFFPLFQKAARDVNESLPPDATMEIYRFDTGVNEIYVGPALGAGEFKRRLVSGLAKERAERGTSLLKLAQRLDERLTVAPSAEVLIGTDCGIEGMTSKEHADLKAIAAKWKAGGKVRSLRFLGVRPMHHDRLRADFAPIEDKLQIL